MGWISVTLSPADPLSTLNAQVHVLLPALRADVAALPQLGDASSSADSQPERRQAHSQAGNSQRRYLTCCVRLSPEKEPHRFVEIIKALAGRPAIAGAPAQITASAAARRGGRSNGGHAQYVINGSGSSGSTGLRSAAYAAVEALQGGSGGTEKRNRLQQLGVVPLLCGAADTEYAEAIRARLRLAAPDAVIERRFLSPMQLAEVGTRLYAPTGPLDAVRRTRTRESCAVSSIRSWGDGRGGCSASMQCSHVAHQKTHCLSTSCL